MNLETQPRSATGVCVIHRHETVFPSVGKNSGFHRHTVRIIAESLVKGGTFANGSINQIGIGGITQREEIGLNRNEQFSRRLGELTKNGLTAHDDKFPSARDARRRADDVLKLWSLHGAGGWRTL